MCNNGVGVEIKPPEEAGIEHITEEEPVHGSEVLKGDNVNNKVDGIDPPVPIVA